MKEIAVSKRNELDVYRGTVKRKYWMMAGSALLLLAVILWSAAVGASTVNMGVVLQVLGEWLTGAVPAYDMQWNIVMNVRLPRIFAAAFAGGALSLAGLLMQGIFQNPLVSPYTLGVSNGASFGASLAIVLSYKLPFMAFQAYVIPAFAFFFAILTMLMVYAISRIAGHSTRTLVLTGVAVGYLFSALVSGLKYVADVKDLPELIFWTMGSLKGLQWNIVGILLAVLAISVVVAMLKAWDLNVMAQGQEEAMALGVDYKRIQIMTFVFTTILTATAVSFTGVIGFVGLVAPHITRMLVGNDYRYCVPLSVLLGSLLLLASDTLARTIFAPTELPVGIITSLIGVPFYLYLVVRRRRVG